MSNSSPNIRDRRILLSMFLIVLESSACGAKNVEMATTADAMQTGPVMATASANANKPSSSGAAGRSAATAAGSSGASMPTRTAGAAGASQAGAGAAGVSGSSALPTAGQAGTQMRPEDDADGGVMPGVTIIAKAAFANPAPVVMVDGASCAAGSCTLAAPADGKLKVALTLEHNSSGDPMPVLARWNGCGMPSTTFFPVMPSGTSYVLNYETQLSDLHPGSACTAEIVQGAWLVFAGNMSLEVTEGKAFCTSVQVSEMGVNASCFPPADTKITIKSDLPRWDCVSIAPDGMDKDMSYTQQTVSFTSQANQLVSCTGAAQ